MAGTCYAHAALMAGTCYAHAVLTAGTCYAHAVLTAGTCYAHAGCNDYLTKPFGVQELNARIDVQLKLKQLWSALDPRP
eukprot:1061241-Rhodomonas_salina.1